MSPHLLLRLPDHPDQPVHWLLWAQEKQDQRPVTGQATGHIIASGCWPDVPVFIEEYARSGEHSVVGSPVTVLVPATRVTTHSLEIQGRLTPNIRQSLPWRLEDEFSEDVENLHFAVLGHGDGQVHLGVTRQSDMMLWQNWLAMAGVHSQRWVPDALMLPAIEDNCCLLEVDGVVLARYGQWQIAACDPQWLPLFLDGLKNDSPDLKIIQAGSRSEIDFNKPVQAENIQTALSLLAPAATTTQLNLLQGQWQLASPWRKHLRPWRSIAMMGCVLLGLMTINSVLATRQLEQEAIHLQQQANGIYQKLFPGERVVQLQSQMRQKLGALQQPDTASGSMLSVLSRITPVLNAFPEMKATSMDFSMDRDGTRQSLRIQAQANDFELFTRLREQFETDISTGLTIAIEALERTGDKVTGVVVISGGLS